MMSGQHIIEDLDNKPFAEIGEQELSQMESHTAECAECMTALRAAKHSAAVLMFEAAQATLPSPFFHARVLAALKEKPVLRPVLDFWKMWQATGAMVSMMVVMVAALFAASTIAPEASGAAATDTAEAVIFEQENTLKDITNEQIFQEIYER